MRRDVRAVPDAERPAARAGPPARGRGREGGRDARAIGSGDVADYRAFADLLS